ncbi:MFS transporter [Sulfobacillus harzensis]|uniref:Sugar porter family MFS transporter n=1 Tax=Sulfobacillus harzensis TaxID=2729629 RepID=A0A7Y0L370_9FIRM|nr:MFS transporter [Sulfobacillus harzensis]NMP22360.1 sugar porter family MFS transporter [Sulfobacillus harzensis]
MATYDAKLINQAIDSVVEKHSPRGNRIGWLMIASIFVEAWDLYSISFVLIFLEKIYHPSSWLLGMVGAAVQGGAVIGAVVGGWLTDRLGRRTVFLGTMLMFFVVGIAQAFSPNMGVLTVLRFILGIPLGMDIANGYTYIMESVQRGHRDVMGNRWQFVFAVGEVFSIAVVLLFLVLHVPYGPMWRVILGLSGVWALILFFLRRELPETVIWLIQKGRFKEAKRTAEEMYGDDLDMLPDEDVEVPEVHLGGFLREIRKDRTRWRASIFGWIAGFMQSSEFSTFGFYLPVLFVLLGVSDVTTTDFITLLIYLVAVISGWVGPALVLKIGQRKLSMYGFGIVFVALIGAAVAIFAKALIILPIAAAVMLWGHYWDAENVMTIPSMVAPARYRGTASGFSYIWVKIPGFLSTFLYPKFFDAIGKGGATLFTAIFPLIGLLAAIFILPEVYRFKGES